MKNATKRNLTLTCLVIWAYSAAAQDTSSIVDIERPETYGNCQVFDEINMLTDDVTHNLQCRDATFTDETTILFFVSDSGDFAVAISKGAMFYLDDFVEVAVRVDRGELRTGNWPYANNYAFVFGDSDFFHSLLTEISNGDRVAMRVGDESGNILLEGADRAVQDFVSRIEHILLVDYK